MHLAVTRTQYKIDSANGAQYDDPQLFRCRCLGSDAKVAALKALWLVIPKKATAIKVTAISRNFRFRVITSAAWRSFRMLAGPLGRLPLSPYLKLHGNTGTHTKKGY